MTERTISNARRTIDWVCDNRKDKCLRREKERSRTQRFILVHPSSRATSSPLPTRKEFH